jgi:hypothetical protein
MNAQTITAHEAWIHRNLDIYPHAAFASALLYIVPGTSVLGAILLTGYLGGATATHVRIGDPFIGPVLFGVLVWAGLFLRDDRLRALLSLRSRR